MLIAISKALSIPADLVFEQAGLLPPERGLSVIDRQIQYYLERLPETEKQDLLDLAAAKYQRHERDAALPGQT